MIVKLLWAYAKHWAGHGDYPCCAMQGCNDGECCCYHDDGETSYCLYYEAF
jgi:hypothetical protein